MDESNAYSPYGASGAPGQNNQLAMILKQLLGNQQNQPGSGGGGPPQATQPGQGMPGSGGQPQNPNLPFSSAGNLIQGLFNPPSDSILGQARTKLSNLFQGPGTSASPTPTGTGLGTYEGNIPSPANPAGPGTMGIMPSASNAPPSVTGGAGNMGGGATDPMSFAGPPTTMGAGSMGADPGAAVNPFGFGGGANPASVDAMTQALMTPPTAAGMNPAGFGGASSLSDMLML
jgi:hypothetical protein